ncbi:MAG: hypothetical protein CSA83_01265 [Actinomycetales bacterium]|nr:MAG: hypothetical protein CSA83_01265 [Actinomycetales bacterium]
MPKCPTKLVTGYDCAACGGLRMAHSVLHGNLKQAAQENLYLLIALPIAAVLLVIWAWHTWNGRNWRVPLPAAVVFLITAIAWMIIRNI